eukprot:756928-Hanusia_phi.AAC.1
MGNKVLEAKPDQRSVCRRKNALHDTVDNPERQSKELQPPWCHHLYISTVTYWPACERRGNNLNLEKLFFDPRQEEARSDRKHHRACRRVRGRVLHSRRATQKLNRTIVGH